jgi:raffinose/stachyose/melibiose transport system substrate-binding protein
VLRRNRENTPVQGRGCSDGHHPAGTDAASGSGGSGRTGSTVLALASVDQGSVGDVAKAFEAANPGVTVRYTTSGSADRYQQQIRTRLASGTAPDVMSVWPGNGNHGATYVLGKYDAIYGLNGIGAVCNEQALARRD